LTSTIHTTETRLNELYNEQARSEAEMAQRIDIADKLRSQIREMEKEKRDTQRRYNEQVCVVGFSFRISLSTGHVDYDF